MADYKNAVIFDLDGTLVDTLGDLAASCNYALAKFGFETHGESEYRFFVGGGRSRLIRAVLPEDEIDEETYRSVLAAFDEHYSEHYLVRSAPYPGVPELLARLAALGAPLALLSNKPHEYTSAIAAALFPSVPFLAVYGQRKDKPLKPDPAALSPVLDALGVPPGRCLYVGDSNVDVLTAKNAGMRSVGVAWGFRPVEELIESGADYIARSPSDIYDIASGAR